MKRRLSTRALGWLLGLTFVLVFGVHLLHGYQVRRNTAAMLGYADRAEQAGEKVRALEYLGRYLTYAPDDAPALARYARGLLKLSGSAPARARAFLLLERSLRVDPSRHDVRRDVVPVAMGLGRYADAREHLETLLREGAPDDPELERLLGDCLRAEGKFAAAAAAYEKSLRHAPGGAEAAASLAGLLRVRLDQPQRADAVMDRLVEAAPDSFRAYLARAAYRRAFDAGDPAEDVARARKLAPDEADVLLASAEVSLDADDPAAARAALEAGLKDHGDDPRLYAALARLDRRQGKTAEALGRLKAGLEKAPEDAGLRWLNAEYLVEANRPKEAGQAIDWLRRQGHPRPALSYLEAGLQAQAGEYLRAAATLERDRPALAGNRELARQADLLQAQCYQRAGDPDRELTALRRAVTADADWAPARKALADALLARGKVSEAVSEYRMLTGLRQAPADSWALLAKALVLHNQLVPESQRDWPGVERALERVKADAPELPLLRARVLAARGKRDDARKELDAARKADPKRLDVWEALLALAGRGPEGDRLLDEARKALGDTAASRLLCARFLAAAPDKSDRERLLKLAEGRERFPDADRESLEDGLADALYRAGHPADAAALWSDLAKRRPHDLRLKLLRFDLALEANDDATLARLRDEVRSAEGEDGGLWRYCEAARLAAAARGGDKSGLPTARRLAGEVAERRPMWSRVAVLVGEIDELEGQPDRAIANYQRALEQGDRRPEVVRGLVRLLLERKRVAEADQALAALQEQAALPPDLGRLAAAASLRGNNRERAIELAKQVAAAPTADHRDHLWLGQLLLAAGRDAEAEQSFRRATRLAPAAPETWVALAQALVRAGKADQALAALRDAEGKVPAEEAFALAAGYDAAGAPDRAGELYRKAAEARPNDGPTLRAATVFFLRTAQAREAVPLLAKLAEPKAQGGEGDRAWAMRRLAVTLAASGNFRQFEEAQKLLKRAESLSPDPVEDQRSLAAVLATRPSRRKEAVRLLERLSEGRAPTADERFLLAQLYEIDGNWKKAKLTWEVLLTEYPNRPYYVAEYVKRLLRRGDVAGARRLTGKLERLEPGTLRTTELRARVLKADGRADDARELVKKFAEQNPPGRASAAALLERLGMADAAEPIFRQWASEGGPERALALAEFLGRAGKVSEALDLCEKAWGACPNRAVAVSSMMALQSPKATPEDFDRVERSIQAARLKAPKDVGLTLAAGQFLYLRGRYDEAEAAYRVALARDPRNPMALNNRAWLLAVHRQKGDEALALIDAAIAQAGPPADLLDTRAVDFPSLNPADQALRQSLPDLLDTRAVVYLTLRQPAKALSDLQAAIAKHPTGLRYFHLAQAHDQAGAPTEAKAALQKALTLHVERQLPALEAKAFNDLKDRYAKAQ